MRGEPGLRWKDASRGPLTRVASELPTRADGDWIVGVEGDAELSLRLRALGATSSPAALEGGLVIYRDALPGLDAIHMHDGHGAELVYLLRETRGSARFEWRVVRGGKLVRARDDGDGGLEFLDQTGRARLFVERPYAIDAKGLRRAAQLTWEADVLGVELDTDGLTPPIALDPYVGTARWKRLHIDPPPRREAALAVVKDRLVMFGGKSVAPFGDTWLWDGTGWATAAATAPNAPSARIGPAMAALGDRAILFGGRDEAGKVLGDTWSWDGASWTKLAPAHAPPPRAFAGATLLGNRVVLYGGEDAGGGDRFDTWLFDGTDWTAPPGGGASPNVSMGWSSAGLSTDGALAILAAVSGQPQTWTFDGASWTDRSATAATPEDPSLQALGMAKGTFTLLTDAGTYAWTGTRWEPHPTPARPTPSFRAFAASAGFRDELWLFGGKGYAGDLADLWRYDGATWSPLRTNVAPPGRMSGAVANLDGRIVLFGGSDPLSGRPLDDTWELDGSRWRPLTPAAHPPATLRATMAPAGDRTLLAQADGQAWTWDHTAWTNVKTVTRPTFVLAKLARVGTANVLVTSDTVFIGKSRVSTFSWTGSDWKELTTSPRPAAFGGFTSFADTGLFVDLVDHEQWTWSETGWAKNTANVATQLGALSQQSDGSLEALELGRFALLQGDGKDFNTNESWLWDGERWSQLAIDGLPTLAGFSMAARGSEAVLFGGIDADGTPSSATYAMTIALANGTGCKSDAECDSAVCTKGLCCDRRCEGAADSCALPASLGTCAPLQAACVGFSTLQGADGTQSSCDPYRCVAAACLKQCASSADCVGGAACDDATHACTAILREPAPSGGCALGPGRRTDAEGVAAFAAAGLTALAVALRRQRAARARSDRGMQPPW